MSMDGEVASSRRSNIIVYFLQSGSSRVLNSLRVAEQLRETKGGEHANLLFRTPVLNRSLIFKDLRMQSGAFGSGAAVSVGTKLYVPFNRNKVAEGGQTFFFDRRDFQSIMGNFVDLTEARHRESLVADAKVLEVLDTLPMFAPFLLRHAFEQNHIDADPAYVDIPDTEWEEICAFIRTRFQQILQAVNGQGPVKGDALNRLLDKLWELNDIPALESLARAFGLPSEGCIDTFYAWKGTLYFCWSFEKLQKAVFELTSWLLEWPRLINAYPPNMREGAKHKLQTAHDDVFQQLRSVELLLAEYERAFNDLFVHGAGPGRFIEYLGNARSRFNDCGIGIGMLQHAHEVWDRLTESFPRRQVSFHVLDEVIHALNGVISRPA